MRPAIFFLLVCCLCSPLAIARADSGDQPFRLHSIHARFVQKKEMKILARPLVSTGTFIFEAPQSLRWQYHQPVASLLLMHEGRIRKFVGRNGKLVEEKGAQLDGMQMVLAQLSDWLDGRFSDNEMFRVVSADEAHVVLEPHQPGLARLIPSIEIVFGKQRGLIDAIKLHEGPEAATTITFSDRILNEEIAETVFISK